MTAQKKTLLQRLIVLALLIAMVAPLTACGRKGSPKHPEGSQYPHSYPKQQETP